MSARQFFRFVLFQFAFSTILLAQGPPVVRPITGNIYEYDYLLTTGPGVYHQVGVHRVVQVQNGNPSLSHDAIFFAHGIFENFDAFMGATHSAQSLPVYLASNGIDVWGIDYGWALVPLTETNFMFMQGWGLQRDVEDLEQALAFARQVRSSTGSDGGRLTLLGHSLSVFTGFALLNEETQSSCGNRNVKAWIPSDEFFKNEPGTGVQGSCAADYGSYNKQVAKGIYADGAGAGDNLGGTLAQTDPNDTSPFFPQYTNLQAFLVVTAATWELQPHQPPFRIRPPFGHYYAGTFGPLGINGTPTALQYTNITRAENQYINGPPFVPLQLEADLAVTCPGIHRPFDDHLQEITVPVFYLGAAGGTGTAGLYSLTLVGSSDVTSYIVSFYPPDQVAMDYAHDDLYDADNAQAVVWSKILQWLQNHPSDNSCSQ